LTPGEGPTAGATSLSPQHSGRYEIGSATPSGSPLCVALFHPHSGQARLSIDWVGGYPPSFEIRTQSQWRPDPPLAATWDQQKHWWPHNPPHIRAVPGCSIWRTLLRIALTRHAHHLSTVGNRQRL